MLLRRVCPLLLLSATVGAFGCAVESGTLPDDMGGSDDGDGDEGGGGGGGGGDSGGSPDAGGGGGAATVSMAHVVVQSQVEPYRGDQPDLPGDDAVEAVQQALAAKGFAATVDGWYGNETSSLYADYQESLGYSGLGANGIPGPTSLTMLGEGRFEVEDLIDIGPHVTFSGKTVNQRTKDALTEAQALLGFDIVLSQGSYNAGGVAASAGTHDGGGAFDVSVSALSTTQRWQTVKALRTVGIAAWLRTPDQGDWPYHIHGIVIGDTDLPTSARNQVADYYVGKNGLASHAADNTPAEYRMPFTWWEQYKAP